MESYVAIRTLLGQNGVTDEGEMKRVTLGRGRSQGQTSVLRHGSAAQVRMISGTALQYRTYFCTWIQNSETWCSEC